MAALPNLTHKGAAFDQLADAAVALTMGSGVLGLNPSSIYHTSIPSFLIYKMGFYLIGFL